MNGPIYVTGNFNISGPNTSLNLNNNFGSTGTVMIVDGIINVNQGSINPTNATPPGFILVATTSNSSSAINIGNRGENAIFYALNGGANMNNRSEVNAIVAQTLNMNNNSELEYHSSDFASTTFTSGPGGTWQIKKGTYRQTSSP